MDDSHGTAEEPSTTGQRVAAELFGTFALVLVGCGAALMSDWDPVATGLAFGLTMAVLGSAVGRVSGGHFNPAITVGSAIGGRLPWRRTPAYVGAQLLGALLAAAVLFALMHGFDGYSSDEGLAQNSFGDQGSGYAWWAAFLLELLLTAILVWVVLALTDARNGLQAAVAPLAIGLTLAVLHLASIGATGTSVNPARSIGPAAFAGVDALVQLWLFVLAPILGALLAGLTYPLFFGHGAEPVEGSGLGGRRQARADAVPAGGSGPWEPGGAQPWQPAPPPLEQQWQPGQSWQGGPPVPPTPPPAPRHWGPPAADPPPPAPQQWGRPDDDEDGRTQIRRPD